MNVATKPATHSKMPLYGGTKHRYAAQAKNTAPSRHVSAHGCAAA
jgi:hypothetical protein